MFVKKAFLLGLFSGELIFGGAYYWKEFCILKWVGLVNENSLKHYENSLKHYENSLKQLALTVHRRAYYRRDFCLRDLGGLFLGGLIIGILRYANAHSHLFIHFFILLIYFYVVATMPW